MKRGFFHIGGVFTLSLCALSALYADESKSDLPVGQDADMRPSDHYEYVGTKKCRMCHPQQYKSWHTSAKGNSFDALKPGMAKELKLRIGLDLAKDYTSDSRCLECHTVGFGKPSGYAIPKPDDKRSRKHASAREGVGCESCHGPGSGYIKIMQDISRSDRMYDPSELAAHGRHPVDQSVCLTCHNSSAPCTTAFQSETGTPDSIQPGIELSNRQGYHKAFLLKRRKTDGDIATDDKRNASPKVIRVKHSGG